MTKSRFNPLLTNPKKILYLIEFIFQKLVPIKKLLEYIPIADSQMAVSLNRLERRGLIVREKFGRETKIRITERGSKFSRNYQFYVKEQIRGFYFFLKSIKAFDTKKVVDLEKPSEEDIILGDIHACLITRKGKKGLIFEALNNDPNLKNIDLSILFPHISKPTISNYHSEWIEIQTKSH